MTRAPARSSMTETATATRSALRAICSPSPAWHPSSAVLAQRLARLLRVLEHRVEPRHRRHVAACLHDRREVAHDLHGLVVDGAGASLGDVSAGCVGRYSPML